MQSGRRARQASEQDSQQADAGDAGDAAAAAVPAILSSHASLVSVCSFERFERSIEWLSRRASACVCVYDDDDASNFLGNGHKKFASMNDSSQKRRRPV